jgi:hypothetical protein
MRYNAEGVSCTPGIVHAPCVPDQKGFSFCCIPQLNPMKSRFTMNYFLLVTALSLTITSGCTVEASKAIPDEVNGSAVSRTAETRHGATIDIEPNGPADTVRVFYKYLREKKFREAIYLTNLRPAIEGLTDTELKEFQVDFEAIAAVVPAEVEINGEIVSGNNATVTAKLPDENDKLELQEIKLRNENGVWVILSADGDTEKKIKKEGKNYFYVLRIETHEDEARKMLDRISKAEMVYALQNGDSYGDLKQLIDAGLLPEDAEGSESTGYRYILKLSEDKRSYSVTAQPAEYGKTGKLTFTVLLNEKRQPHLSSKDLGK